MSFPSESVKQRLNLSLQGYEVMQNDMFAFGADNLSGFTNRVFAYYAPEADASVSLVLRRRRDSLEKSFQSVPGDESTKKRIVRKLLSQEERRLKDQIGSYGKGNQISFSLNRENLAYLLEKSECAEEKYYKKRGDYIKAVLEEYARLPYVKRERIYFSPFMEEIKGAIQKQIRLRVVTGADKVYSVYPFEVLCDPLSTANYLVGYSKRYDHPEDAMRPCSYRISALKSIKGEKSKSAFLKGEQRKELTRIIAARGVQFMSSEEKEIHVRLTEAGAVKFQRQVHLRPALVRTQGDVFVFQCTEAQAQFYFFKFGADAEILRPASLRERFKSMYENSLLTYDGDSGGVPAPP